MSDHTNTTANAGTKTDNAKRLDAVLEVAVSGVIFMSCDGIIQTFNPAAEKMFGYKADEVVGKNISILMPKKDARYHADYVNHYLETGNTAVIGVGREVDAKHKNGTIFPVEIGVSEVVLSDERFFVGMIYDISKRKKLQQNLRLAKEEAEQASAHKSHFLTNISHELRTPLHTILGLTETVIEKMDRLPQEKQQQYLEIVHASSSRLLSLIDDLLDLAKLEAGMMRFLFEEHDFRSVIETAIHETQNLLEEKELNVSVLSDSDVSAVFDKKRMIQVVINLLSNAGRFTPEGKTITVTVEKNDAWLTVEVADQGPGIPEGEEEKVFKKFVQSSQRCAGMRGTGLGLSICKEIIHAHQGNIFAKNNNEGGASFFFKLPLNLAVQTVEL